MDSDPIRRTRGIATMEEVYGWKPPDVPGDYMTMTIEHLFAHVWNRPGLSVRDRRLMLFGVMAALGETGLAAVQVQGALDNAEFTGDQLREIVIFLAHYVGWPRATGLNTIVETALAKRDKAATDGRE